MLSHTHTHLPSFTNTKKKIKNLPTMCEEEEGIWKKGIEKHCSLHCWGKK
jgi:hypothetical protein